MLIGSNPCLELWFLMHFQDVKAQINTNECISKLILHCKKYKKGNLDSKLIQALQEKQSIAIKRAEKLEFLQNPSTQVHTFILDLEKECNKHK